jgi:hypothetical protein
MAPHILYHTYCVEMIGQLRVPGKDVQLLIIQEAGWVLEPLRTLSF